jgi:hypothetical protein
MRTLRRTALRAFVSARLGRRSAISVGPALIVTALSGSCMPVCGCSPPYEPVVIDSIEFEAPAYAVALGGVALASMVARSGGNTVPPFDVPTITFAVSDSAIVSVVSTGGQIATLSGLAVGDAVLTATVEGLSTTTTVQVRLAN